LLEHPDSGHALAGGFSIRCFSIVFAPGAFLSAGIPTFCTILRKKLRIDRAAPRRLSAKIATFLRFCLNKRRLPGVSKVIGVSLLWALQTWAQGGTPTLSTISPSTVLVGSTGVVLTISGFGFGAKSVARIGANALPATVVSGTSITVAVPDSLFTSPGVLSVTVANPPTLVSNTLSLAVQSASVAPTTTPQAIPEVEGGNVNVGYVIITPDAGTVLPLTTVTYGIVRSGVVQSQAGVLPVPMTGDSSMYAGVVTGIGRNLGVAVSNPGSSANTLTLTLKDPTGSIQGSPASITLQPGQQFSRFVNELFGASAVGSGFTGSLRIQAASPFSLLGLLFSGAEFSTLPIANTNIAGVPARTLAAGSVANSPAAGSVGGPNAVIIPQFAMGGGWATQIAMVNSTGASVTGRIDVLDSLGNPLPVKLNGTTQSTFMYSVDAGGTLLLAPRDTNGQSPF
jgi:hypothetical protein